MLLMGVGVLGLILQPLMNLAYAMLIPIARHILGV